MSSAIEVLKQYKEMALKRYNEEGFIPDKSFADALDDAIVALEKLPEYEKKLHEEKDKMEENILSAKRCLEFGLRRCDNKDCLNESCPLNKKYDKKELKK